MALIAIHTELLDDIKARAESAYPQECCGLLVGRTDADGVILATQVVPSPNVSKTNTKDSFEVDAKIRFEVMRAVKNTPNAIIGHYHSHPDHPAKPSQTDLDLAFEPEFVWLIVAVDQGQSSETKAWHLDREQRTSTPLTLLVSQDE